MSLVGRVRREDGNPRGEAQGLRRLTTGCGRTQEKAARAVGRSGGGASNRLRLLELAPPVQQMLMAGDLDMGHARALLPLERARQITCANEIVARRLSVRETEHLVARQSVAGAPRNGSQRTSKAKSRDLLRLEEQLSDRLAAPVEIRMRKRGGRGEVSIAFGSLDELNGLLDKLGVEP